MRRIRLLRHVLPVILICGLGAHGADRKEWIQLFNGRDLEDWAVKIRGYDLDDNFGNTFRVEDGLLKVVYDAYESFDNRFGYIFYKQKFSHYIIAVEYRFVGDQVPGGPNWARRNSGIMVHSPPPETMGKDRDSPISIEVQLLGGLGEGERPTANLCTPGTHVVMEGKLVTRHCITSRSETFHGDQWVRVETMVLGDSTVRHTVNGEGVLSYEIPQIGGGSVSGFDEKGKTGRQTFARWLYLPAERKPSD